MTTHTRAPHRAYDDEQRAIDAWLRARARYNELS